MSKTFAIYSADQRLLRIVSTMGKPEDALAEGEYLLPVDALPDFSAIVEADPEQPTADEQTMRLRHRRNALLTASDWTQVADAPVDRAAWAAYRQALRDLPQQPGFPEVIDWPEPPA